MRWVAPFAGAWIEIARPRFVRSARPRSLPSRERGLKSCHSVKGCPTASVAPFAGAWIEIAHANQRCKALVSLPSRERGLKLFNPKYLLKAVGVAPFAGAWIEIGISSSPLSGEKHVAPFAGAWIEMTASARLDIKQSSRSLRGSVD